MQTGQPILYYEQQLTALNGFNYLSLSSTYPIMEQGKTIGAIEFSKQFYESKQIKYLDNFLGHKYTALSSDAPATSWAEAVNPFVMIQAAFTRTAYDGTNLGAAERISVEQALQLYTVDGKTMIRMENVSQLKEGYYANFVVLTDDLLTISHDQLMHVKPFATYIEGQCAFTQSTVQA
ncbi:amidohydrolase family protein [Lysinibacillus cavernae]|uniref:amidohydrolase family protein n=1 Tax=Lysinibacillus cavernae TaxID=2666135 RepID=UPI001E3A840E|nr:amidohydrolase family protein [Lysinibacillus cavernae]